MRRPTIARALGVTRHAVGRWERGETMPNRESLERLVALAHQKGIVLLASDLITGPGKDAG